MSSRLPSLRQAPTLLAALVLAACSDTTTTATTYSIGGTVAGLTGSGLVLATPGLPDLTIAAGQATFTFSVEVLAGATYAVTVKSQPAAPDQVCTVANGTGTVGGADVTGVAVSCVAAAGLTATGSLTLPRAFFAAERLPSGEVLAAGGQVFYADWATASVERWSPVTGTWNAAASMGAPRDLPCSVSLPSGKVLVAGGSNPATVLATAEVYDPEADAWTPTAGPMSVERGLHTCTLLGNGKVLVAGGCPAGTAPATSSAELYDPATGLFTPTGSLLGARYYHTATLLPSGKVLVAGGCTSGWPCTASTAAAELYDPLTGTWSATGALPAAVVAHAAAPLPSGQVLVAGGCETYVGCGDSARDRGASLYDPATGTWQATGALGRGRSDFVLVPLGSGQVLALGGAYFSTPGRSTERWDPVAGSWVEDTDLLAQHDNGLRVVPLAAGRWLVAGGSYPGVTVQFYTGAAEILVE